ncbi:MAG: hypothetical protein JXA74_02000 [Anaerolineae bacterium]|nr:hypothetical protein [Anaerolineae bacterium]
MKNNRLSPLVWGAILIVLGALFLLQNLGILGSLLSFVWVLIFAAAGAAFLYVFVSEQQRWWAAIPGFSLLGLAFLIGVESAFPRLGDLVGAPVFLGAISLSFWAVYLRERRFWWAIIPGGVMASVAALVFVEGLNPPFDVGGIILLGIGLTFALVGTVKTEHGHMRWAWIPAGVMAILGILILGESVAALRYLWPVVLIGAGALFVIRGWGRAGSAGQAEDSGSPTSKPDTRKLDSPWKDDQPGV